MVLEERIEGVGLVLHPPVKSDSPSKLLIPNYTNSQPRPLWSHHHTCTIRTAGIPSSMPSRFAYLLMFLGSSQNITR